MCIIQGSSSDFYSESPKMGDYYSNAACCISASAANNSSAGFLTERPLGRFPMDNFAIRIARHHKHGPGYSIFQAMDNTPSLKRPLLGSPLTKRGWCLQETALPQRILHWTLQGLYLECQTSLFLEDTKVPWQDEFWAEIPTPRGILSMPENDILFSDGWYRLVSIFSETQLTYETDRLYAIHGVVSSLIRRLRVEYFNGLFRTSLAQGLLWYHQYSRHGTYTRPKTAQLPSWCWASSCPVACMSIYQNPIFIKDDHPERPLRLPTHSEDIDMVESPDSRLYIRAPIIQLRIKVNGVGYREDQHSDHTVSFEFWYWLDRQRKVMQSMAQICPEYRAEWGQGVSVLWLPVGRSVETYSTVVGLLIHELPNEGKGVYCRYGLLEYKNWDSEEPFRDLREIILI